MADFIIPKPGSIKVGNDGFYVIIQQDSKTMLIPWKAALEVAKAIRATAKKVEEIVKVEQISGDQALLIRLGIPLGLTDNPDIKKEAFNKSQYDPGLRRYITGARAIGIQSGEVVGTPKFIQHEPRGGNDNGKSGL